MAATRSSASPASATARAARSTVVVGALALLASVGQGGRAGDSKDALRAVLAGPFGALVVGLIALGLCGFALWRLVEGVTDADRRGTSAKGLAVRGAPT